MTVLSRFVTPCSSEPSEPSELDEAVALIQRLAGNYAASAGPLEAMPRVLMPPMRNGNLPPAFVRPKRRRFR